MVRVAEVVAKMMIHFGFAWYYVLFFLVERLLMYCDPRGAKRCIVLSMHSSCHDGVVRVFRQIMKYCDMGCIDYSHLRSGRYFFLLQEFKLYD